MLTLTKPLFTKLFSFSLQLLKQEMTAFMVLLTHLLTKKNNQIKAPVATVTIYPQCQEADLLLSY